MSNVKVETGAEKQKRLYKQYIQDKRVVIVDAQAYSRAALAQTLVDLGTPSSRIDLTRTFDEAKQLLQQRFADIVISEFDLDAGNCGLDLLHWQRSSNKESLKSLFILVTSNTSQAAVARAAEEDVDGYLLKPYTMDGLRNSIMRYAVIKAYPNEYTQMIEQGKEELAKKDIEKALEIFQKATTLDSKPALALFYHGQAEEIKKTLSNAESDYSKGLSYSRIHYKCLIGLFELFYEQSRNREAYEVVRKIAQYFPANPDRLATVLRLAVINNAYEDIEKYYQLFCKLDKRNESLIRYVCAALIVCGRYYLLKKSPSRAIELFNKAKATGARNPRLLKEIITALLEYDMVVEAEEFLKAYPPDQRGASVYFALEYLVFDRKSSLGASLGKGKELLAKGLQEPMLFEVMIKRSLEAKHDDSAEQLYEKACKLWPEQKEHFEKKYQEAKTAIASASSKSIPKK